MTEGGPLPITFADLLAWSAVMRTEPRAWEIDTLRALDAEWLTEHFRARKEGKT